VNITVLLIVAYLTTGAPVPYMFVLPEGHPCGPEVAADYARRFIVPVVPEGSAIQGLDTLLHLCAPVPHGTPGPAMRPALFPGLTEAHR
jgi:hypothetical protein